MNVDAKVVYVNKPRKLYPRNFLTKQTANLVFSYKNKRSTLEYGVAEEREPENGEESGRSHAVSSLLPQNQQRYHLITGIEKLLVANWQCESKQMYVYTTMHCAS